MHKLSRMVVLVALMAIGAGSAWAEQGVPRNREPEPQAAIAAAVANVVFIPIRMGISVIGGELGGLVGFLTAGNRDAAHDVWDLFQGQSIITPDMAAGRESLEFGTLEFRAEPRP